MCGRQESAPLALTRPRLGQGNVLRAGYVRRLRHTLRERVVRVRHWIALLLQAVLPYRQLNSGYTRWLLWMIAHM